MDDTMKFDYYYGIEAEQFSFYRVPHPYGFDDAISFTDSKSMFEDLWEEWLNTKLVLLAKGTPMAEMGYEEIFKCLPKEKQKELTDRKADFAKKAEIEL